MLPVQIKLDALSSVLFWRFNVETSSRTSVLCSFVTLELSSLHFVFACDVKTRTSFCVCLWRYNLTRSVLCLLVQQQLSALWFKFVCDATLQLSPLYSIFACDARTNRAPFRVCLRRNSARSTLCFHVQLHLTSLRFVFACTVTTWRAMFCVCLHSYNL